MYRNSEGPLEISFSMRLIDVFDISHHDFSTIISVYYSLGWIDNRILLDLNQTYANLDVAFIENIWVILISIINII